MDVWFRRGFFKAVKPFCNYVLGLGDIKVIEEEAVVGRDPLSLRALSP